MTLRPYQQLVVDAIIHEISTRPSGNAVVCAATGSGKSLIIAEVANRLNKPILIIVPTREILEQNVEKMLQYVPRSEVGIYSASMDEKTIGKYTFATIQSIYKKPEQFIHFGLVIIDECDGLNPVDTGTMFQLFLSEIGDPRVVGLTATPYRQSHITVNFGQWNQERVTTTKIITRMKGQRDSMFWSRIIANVTMEELIRDGYLCQPVYYDNSTMRHKDIPLNKTQSEFDLEKYEQLVQKNEYKILDAVQRAQEVSKSVLVFCVSVEQAWRFAEVVNGARVVSAKTPAGERKKIVDGFKDGNIKTVFNCNVFSVGFDHKKLDAIIILRPTNSIRIWVQQVGRGVRTAEGKDHCKIIDFSGNLKRYGRVETIQLKKRGNLWELESETQKNWHGMELRRYR